MTLYICRPLSFYHLLLVGHYPDLTGIQIIITIYLYKLVQTKTILKSINFTPSIKSLAEGSSFPTHKTSLD